MSSCMFFSLRMCIPHAKNAVECAYGLKWRKEKHEWQYSTQKTETRLACETNETHAKLYLLFNTQSLSIRFESKLRTSLTGHVHTDTATIVIFKNSK